jgi:hypothetical protein
MQTRHVWAEKGPRVTVLWAAQVAVVSECMNGDASERISQMGLRKVAGSDGV